ncbi:hypothetical protein BDF21DRAFT_403540 [Thamnidium elegans]|nr:hypothetical protein BDF21DRAFT_403540 [Thamnidium elegans]
MCQSTRYSGSYQVYGQKYQHYVSDSELGTDDPLSSPSTTPSTSASSLHSEKNGFAAVVNKQKDIDNQVYGEAWGPPILGGNMMTVEPLRLNGTFNLNEKKKKSSWRCSFIHPKDLVNAPKKHSSSTGIPKRNSPERSSSGRRTASDPPSRANSYSENSNRSSFISLN